MLLVGDKIKCKLEMGGVIKVGEVCEVTNLSNMCIEFKFRGIHKGVMSYEEFEKYFTKEEKSWGEWVLRCDGGLFYKYRTNGKTVQVKLKNSTGLICKGSCTCHKDDIFDLEKGVELAFNRAVQDSVKKKEKELLKNM